VSNGNKHVIEVSAHPYTAANPRRYFATDYAQGSAVMDGTTVYLVRDVGNVLMFVPVTHEPSERNALIASVRS
jgi:hypothetical protein